MVPSSHLQLILCTGIGYSYSEALATAQGLSDIGGLDVDESLLKDNPLYLPDLFERKGLDRPTHLKLREKITSCLNNEVRICVVVYGAGEEALKEALKGVQHTRLQELLQTKYSNRACAADSPSPQRPRDASLQCMDVTQLCQLSEAAEEAAPQMELARRWLTERLFELAGQGQSDPSAAAMKRALDKVVDIAEKEISDPTEKAKVLMGVGVSLSVWQSHAKQQEPPSS